MLAALKDAYSVFWVDLRNLKHRWLSLLVTSLVQPLLYLVAFGYGLGREVRFEGFSYLTFVIPGIVALTSFSTSFNGSASKLQVDKFFYKSFDELLISPISLFSIVVGKALIGLVRGLLSSVAILLVGFALSPTFEVSLLFLLVLFLSCFVFSLFGVLIAFVLKSHQSMSTFNSVVMLPMTFLCGTFFSLNALPEVGRAMLYVLPLTHSSQTLRAVALGQDFPWLSFGVLVCFGALFFFASILVLKKQSV